MLTPVSEKTLVGPLVSTMKERIEPYAEAAEPASTFFARQ